MQVSTKGAPSLLPLESIEDSFLIMIVSGLKICHCNWIFQKSINNSKNYMNNSNSNYPLVCAFCILGTMPIMFVYIIFLILITSHNCSHFPDEETEILVNYLAQDYTQ